MTRFIVCSTPSIEYGGQTVYTHVNPPINIDNVTKIVKSMHTTYGNSIGNPSIKFHFMGQTPVEEWRFALHTKFEAQKNKQHGRMERVDVVITDERDAEFDKILKEFGTHAAAS